jgi:hypothetical protein
MSDAKTSTFGICDHFGLFTSLAVRLAKSGARVLYSTPIDRRDSISEAIQGDGIQGVECVDDLWPHKKEIDTFVFPDIRHSGMQAELRSQGLAVWGSQDGMELEQNRQFFLSKLAELGLDVPPYTEIRGLSNLAAFLKNEKDIWIKVSKWRGSWETCHWRSWEQDWPSIDAWAVKFGGIKECIRFLCFPKIETDLEIGADTYCIDGQWPSQMLHGIERKNKAYLSAVTERAAMPEQLLAVMDALSPFLKEVGYRNQWSMENRVTEDKNYFIDATCRGGLPSTGSFLMAKNVPEVIYAGARGELVEVDYGFKFSAECAVEIEPNPDGWGTIILKPEVKEALLAQQNCEHQGQLWFPPTGSASGHIGWLVAVGDTPTEVAERMNALADQLPDGADAAVESLADILREVESEEDSGIRFTDEEMPDPEIVLAPSTN